VISASSTALSRASYEGRAESFAAAMLAWLNARFAPAGVTIELDTPLFASRLIDSIRLLELIAWTERATGREIPDARISMDNFRTVRRIAAVFAPGEERDDARDR
jgi:acyl carrier protein